MSELEKKSTRTTSKSAKAAKNNNKEEESRMNLADLKELTIAELTKMEQTQCQQLHRVCAGPDRAPGRWLW